MQPRVCGAWRLQHCVIKYMLRLPVLYDLSLLECHRKIESSNIARVQLHHLSIYLSIYLSNVFQQLTRYIRSSGEKKQSTNYGVGKRRGTSQSWDAVLRLSLTRGRFARS